MFFASFVNSVRMLFFGSFSIASMSISTLTNSTTFFLALPDTESSFPESGSVEPFSFNVRLLSLILTVGTIERLSSAREAGLGAPKMDARAVRPVGGRKREGVVRGE